MDHHQNKRRRITRTPPSCALPDDLIISEILTRLPARCLTRFKSVCRAWLAAIADAAFVRDHHNRSRGAPPDVLIVPRNTPVHDEDEPSEDISFHRLRLGHLHPPVHDDPAMIQSELMLKKSFITDPARELGEGMTTDTIFPTHCDGLVAVATATGEVFVCNPATQEFVALPPATPDARECRPGPGVAAIGFNPFTQRYIVARYFYRLYNVDYDIGHELFTLGGGSGSWELTEDPPLPIMPTRPVCTGGAFYWASTNNSLLKFALRDSNFAAIPLPQGTSYNDSLDSLTSLDGHLCYVHAASATAYDVWQLAGDDDDAGMTWSLRCRVDDLDEGLGCEAFLPVWAGGGRMLVAVDYGKLYWCHEKSGRLEEAVDLEEDVDLGPEDGQLYRHHVLPYVESLISIRSCT